MKLVSTVPNGEVGVSVMVAALVDTDVLLREDEKPRITLTTVFACGLPAASVTVTVTGIASPFFATKACFSSFHELESREMNDSCAVVRHNCATLLTVDAEFVLITPVFRLIY